MPAVMLTLPDDVYERLVRGAEANERSIDEELAAQLLTAATVRSKQTITAADLSEVGESAPCSIPLPEGKPVKTVYRGKGKPPHDLFLPLEEG